MDYSIIKALTDEVEGELIAYRNYLHENPELSFEEVNTSRFIREKLNAFGIAVLGGFPGTSVIADLDSGVPGPRILFRADIDALPMSEGGNWEHKSKKDGVMHSCGHDTHTANLLAFAQVLATHPELLKRGKVRLCFQAAEEKLPGGAKGLIEAGILDDIDCCFALHSGGSPVKTITITKGNASMNIADYWISVTGKGGHTGSPYLAKDPIAALLDITLGIQRLSSERLDPTRTNIITVASIHAGTNAAPNIIPNEGTIAGTVRCLYAEDMDTSIQAIEDMVHHICAMRGCTADLQMHRGYPGLQNDSACVDACIRAAEACGVQVLPVPASPAGEDFAYYQEKVPGAYFHLGYANPDKEEVNVVHHNPRFFIDEEGMRYGVEIFLKLVTDLLGA